MMVQNLLRNPAVSSQHPAETRVWCEFLFSADKFGVRVHNIVVVWKQKVQLCGKGEEVQTAYIGNVFSFCKRVKYNISQYGIIAHKP